MVVFQSHRVGQPGVGVRCGVQLRDTGYAGETFDHRFFVAHPSGGIVAKRLLVDDTATGQETVKTQLRSNVPGTISDRTVYRPRPE